MGQPSKAEDRRRAFTPRVAAAFAELGYRGTTTAALADRCGVRENVLYRTWPTKRAMFLAAIEYFLTATLGAWDKVAADPPAGGASVALAILDRQASDHGHLRLYRIVFAGLTEDDPEIRAALRDVYHRLHAFIREQVRRHRGTADTAGGGGRDGTDGLAAWALIGLGAVSDILRELEILPKSRRQQFMTEAGRHVLDGA